MSKNSFKCCFISVIRFSMFLISVDCNVNPIVHVIGILLCGCVQVSSLVACTLDRSYYICGKYIKRRFVQYMQISYLFYHLDYWNILLEIINECMWTILSLLGNTFKNKHT